MVFRSLRLKFMLLFFIFFLIPYGLLTFFSISMSKQMMKKSTMDHLQNLVEVKETAIEQWLQERVRDGRTIAESREIKSLDPKQIEPFLSLIKHFERAYLDIWALNLNGQVIAGSGKHFRVDSGIEIGRNGGVFYCPSPRSNCPPQQIDGAVERWHCQSLLL